MSSSILVIGITIIIKTTIIIEIAIIGIAITRFTITIVFALTISIRTFFGFLFRLDSFSRPFFLAN